MKKFKKAMAMGLTALSMASGVKMGATNIQTTSTSSTSSTDLNENIIKNEIELSSKTDNLSNEIASKTTNSQESEIQTTRNKSKGGKGALIAQTIGTVGLVASMVGSGVAIKKQSELGLNVSGVGSLVSIVLLAGSNIGNLYNYAKG